jgi:hypothetical protein
LIGGAGIAALTDAEEIERHSQIQLSTPSLFPHTGSGTLPTHEIVGP